MQQLANGAAQWHHANMSSAIKKIRSERGLTPEQIGEMTGLSKGFLSQIETGKRHASHATLELIANALGCSRSALVADELTAEALRIFEDLPEDDQKEALRFLRFLSAKEASEEHETSGPH